MTDPIISHRIANKLGGILLCAEGALLRKSDDPGWRADVADIKCAADRLVRLLREQGILPKGWSPPEAD